MQYLKLIGIPKLKFAHVFNAEHYKNRLPKRKNYIEISYVAEGSLTAITNSETLIKHTGDITCSFFQENVCTFAEQPHEHHTVCFEAEYELSEELRPTAIPIDTYFPPVKESKKIYHLIDEIIRISKNREDNDLFIASLFLQLLDALSVLSISSNTSEHFTGELYAQKAKTFILNNLQYPIQQKEVAEHLHITPEYLCSVFKNATGETVMSFINRTKLRKIKLLMDRSGVKLYEAAEAFGYSDSNYVSRLYKKLFGKNITEL